VTDATNSVVLDRELEEEKNQDSSAHASDARSAVGLPAKKTSGSAPAVMGGTRSTREECAQPVFTSGLKLSASSAADGRRILNGTGNRDFWSVRSTK
jgi:hypothetical protein